MPRKKKPPLTLKERLMRVHQSGIGDKAIIKADGLLELNSLEERIQKIFNIIDRKDKTATNMLFFVMYDIESNKVRNQVVKYLIKKGCYRIQKSIFLASTDLSTLNKIKEDLVEIQSYYENLDSILIVPISTDYLQAMKVIGKSIDVDVITKTKNVLFF